MGEAYLARQPTRIEATLVYLLVQQPVFPTLAGSNSKEIRPDHQPQDRLPPDQLGEADGEQPANEPDGTYQGARVDLKHACFCSRYHFVLLSASTKRVFDEILADHAC